MTLPLEFCPTCSKADAVTKHTSASPKDIEMSVTVVMPERMCGRCLIQMADAALSAVALKYASLRGKRA